MDRRDFLQLLSIPFGASWSAPLLGGAAPAGAERAYPTRDGDPLSPAERRARVDRHAPVNRSPDPFGVLSVGNGGFAFTADITGLQTFPERHREIPLATQAEWGWHSFPDAHGYRLEDAEALYDAHGRLVPYASAERSAAGAWLRENPHRLSLARIGFVLRRDDGAAAALEDIGEPWQRLDLWSGALTSRFALDGQTVVVTTCVHADRDIVAVRVESAKLDPERLAIMVAFPYGSATHTGDPADWTHPERHHTTVVRADRRGVTWRRALDADGYWAAAAWSDGATLRREAEHRFVVAPRPGESRVELVVAFSPEEPAAPLPSFDEVHQASTARWERFWMEGGVVDLSGSADARATELERRIVLSEYLTAIQCAGTMPPQETGETFNSWFGKFHLEMHWWHAAHFALWGREALLERSLPWYHRILPRARETALHQGYAGARWPKMVAADGRESPSGVGVFLVWQQPHPIHLAELGYRARPERSVLEAHRAIVFETATFMASYPWWDGARRRYVLGPPLIPAQEIHPARATFDPAFELAYWAFALEIAQRWRERLGLARERSWDHVIERLAPLPMRDGLYVTTESAPDTWTNAAQRRDHPSLLGAYGFVASPRVDRVAMRRTLARTLADWQWDTTWGWDYPFVAMTATRLGEPDLAVDALLMSTPKNRFLPNGHNYQRPGLTIYLPGNGGLLSAIALMTAGWDGVATGRAPGFPASGWEARWEKLRPLP